MKRIFAALCSLLLTCALLIPALAGNAQVEAPGEGAASVSNVVSVKNVPMIMLNNGVQMPQLGLGTQIQSLENGDLGVLNQTSREAVASALEAGYRHLDDAHGYLNERGVGQGIRDSGVPREEIWITDKLWPNEYGDVENAIDQMLERLGLDYKYDAGKLSGVKPEDYAALMEEARKL